MHADHDLASIREFDGITDQIGQHLAKALQVSQQAARYAGSDVVDNFNAFLLCPQSCDGRDGLQQFIELKADGGNLQHLSFQFGEVQDVVDDFE